MSVLKIRHVSVIDQGAFGVMLFDDIPFAITLERTYKEGSNQVTKIPQGIHRCTKSFYNKGGYPTFEIHIPGHSRILFHKANKEEELDGCVAIGEEFGVLDGKPAILRSGAGFDEFMRKMSGLEYFDLIVS